MNERAARGLVGMSRSTCPYHGGAPLAGGARAAERHRFGYRRLYVVLRREGYRMNLWRVCHLNRHEGLAVRLRPRRRPPPACRR